MGSAVHCESNIERLGLLFFFHKKKGYTRRGKKERSGRQLLVEGRGKEGSRNDAKGEQTKEQERKKWKGKAREFELEVCPAVG